MAAGQGATQGSAQRYKAAYLLAAAWPGNQQIGGLGLAPAITEAMALHPAEISTQVTTGA